ncbi:MAG: protein kinase domain-containing protein [Candidatus Eiseniibacteriota bacterium]
MTTTTPTTIGPYRVDREIGRGGMGVVFLGHDTRLDRAVAIKALPPDVASDPERLQRFEREAKVLASLNHPNIATIYGVEESGGARYLILERVEGESLAERLARGRLPVGEALEVCHQIAAGLEAAHEGGVIHRDLKPGNVMIASNDVVKILDFGLAKGKVADSDLGQSPASPHSPTMTQSPAFSQSPTLPHSPTFASPATMPGVILGTAAYLSPEQARGKPVDRRTDIWSFGCVLYECLTGRQVFEGETVSDTIAKILERDVDWTRLPANTPSAIRTLLQRCLEKDARKRLRDIGDARIAIEEVRAGKGIAGPTDAGATKAASRFGTRTGLLFGGGLVLGAALAMNLSGMLGPGWNRGAVSQGLTQLSLPIPPELHLLGGSFSPDGRTVLIFAQPRKPTNGQTPKRQLYARRMDDTAFRPLGGTEGIINVGFSPDGKWVLFVAPISERTTERQLSKVPVDGSTPPVPIAKLDQTWEGRPVWLASGDILMATGSGKAYVRISPNGVASKPVPLAAPGFDGRFGFRKALPGDRGVLLTGASYDQGAYHICAGVLDLKSGKVKILVPDGGSPEYSPSGYLLFTKHDVLLAAPFDLGSLGLKGDPLALRGGLQADVAWNHADIRLADNGTLLHVLSEASTKERRLVLVDAGGKVSDWSGEKQPFEDRIAVSPSGRHCAAVIADAGGIFQIWISDRGQPSSRRLVAVPGVDCSFPVWSPDESRMAFAQLAKGDVSGIYVTRTDGSAPPVQIVRGAGTSFMGPTSWSPDGAQLLCVRFGSNKGDIFVAPAAAAQPVEGKPIFATPANRNVARFAPSGRLVAYVSDESGSFEAFVCGWDGGGPTGQPLMVSQGGASDLLGFSPDGRRLYYVSNQHQVMVTAIGAGPGLSASTPTVAWDTDALRIAGDYGSILPDGHLLGIQTAVDEGEIREFNVALNYIDEVRAKLKGGSQK